MGGNHLCSSRYSLLHSDPGLSIAALQQRPPASPPFLTSPKRRSPPPFSPEAGTNGRPQAHQLPYISELQTNIKPPLPKPRLRKTSRGDDIDPTLSPPAAQPHPAEPKVRRDGSPAPPVVRRRLKSKGASPTSQVTNSSRCKADSGEDSSSPLTSQDELLTSSPVRHPAPRTRAREGMATSTQVKPLHQKSSAGGLDTGAPPTPSKRPNKTASESEPKASPVPAPLHHQGSRPRKKGGGIRMPLWKAPPPPTWTPPATPIPKDPTKKEK